MRLFLKSIFLLSLSSFTFSQGTLDIFGHLDNTFGASVNLDFQIYEDSVLYSAVAITDPNGDYMVSIPILNSSSNTSWYTMSFIDCNGISVNTSGFWTPNLVAPVDTLDYCPGSVNNGCASSFTIEQEYSIDSLNPNGIPLAVPNSLIVTNTSQGNGLSYFWDLGDGITSTGFTVSHSYATAGPFNLCLTVSDSTGCSETFCDSIGVNSLGLILGKQTGFTVNITGALNVFDLKYNCMFNIYPNPTSENIKIELGALSERSKFLIIDNAGRLVYSEVIEPSSSNQLITIDLTAISTGIYQVNLFTQHGIVNERLIVR